MSAAASAVVPGTTPTFTIRINGMKMVARCPHCDDKQARFAHVPNLIDHLRMRGPKGCQGRSAGRVRIDAQCLVCLTWVHGDPDEFADHLGNRKLHLEAIEKWTTVGRTDIAEKAAGKREIKEEVKEEVKAKNKKTEDPEERNEDERSPFGTLAGRMNRVPVAAVAPVQRAPGTGAPPSGANSSTGRRATENQGAPVPVATPPAVQPAAVPSAPPAPGTSAPRSGTNPSMRNPVGGDVAMDEMPVAKRIGEMALAAPQPASPMEQAPSPPSIPSSPSVTRRPRSTSRRSESSMPNSPYSPYASAEEAEMMVEPAVDPGAPESPRPPPAIPGSRSGGRASFSPSKPLTPKVATEDVEMKEEPTEETRTLGSPARSPSTSSRRPGGSASSLVSKPQVQPAADVEMTETPAVEVSAPANTQARTSRISAHLSDRSAASSSSPAKAREPRSSAAAAPSSSASGEESEDNSQLASSSTPAVKRPRRSADQNAREPRGTSSSTASGEESEDNLQLAQSSTPVVKKTRRSAAKACVDPSSIASEEDSEDNSSTPAVKRTRRSAEARQAAAAKKPARFSPSPEVKVSKRKKSAGSPSSMPVGEFLRLQMLHGQSSSQAISSALTLATAPAMMSPAGTGQSTSTLAPVPSGFTAEEEETLARTRPARLEEFKSNDGKGAVFKNYPALLNNTDLIFLDYAVSTGRSLAEIFAMNDDVWDNGIPKLYAFLDDRYKEDLPACKAAATMSADPDTLKLLYVTAFFNRHKSQGELGRVTRFYVTGVEDATHKEAAETFTNKTPKNLQPLVFKLKSEPDNHYVSIDGQGIPVRGGLRVGVLAVVASTYLMNLKFDDHIGDVVRFFYQSQGMPGGKAKGLKEAFKLMKS